MTVTLSVQVMALVPHPSDGPKYSEKKTATHAISIKSVPTGTSLPLPADSNPSREHLPVPRCSNPHRAWHQGAKVPIKN